MIMAIAIVMLVAAGGMLLLSNASIGSKSITDNYLKIQADLLAQSATEFALMRAQDANTSTANGCLNNINISVKNENASQDMYDINITLSYSYKNATPTACTSRTIAQNTGKASMVLLDVTVTTNAAAQISTEPIKVHRRSWQKL